MKLSARISKSDPEMGDGLPVGDDGGELRELFAAQADWFRKCGVEELPSAASELSDRKPNPSESNKIQLLQTEVEH